MEIPPELPMDEFDEPEEDMPDFNPDDILEVLDAFVSERERKRTDAEGIAAKK